jgi:hypothetical protein
MVHDFVRRCGVENILGARLLDGPSHCIILGLHQEIAQKPFDDRCMSTLTAATDAMIRAARLHVEFRKLGWRSLVASQALDVLSAGVIVVEADGRVIDANNAAEQILQRNDGLRTRNGQIAASTLVETTELLGLIALAASDAAYEVGRVAVTRRDRLAGYVVTVASLPVPLGFFERPMVILLVRDAEAAATQTTPLGLPVVESRSSQPLPAHLEQRSVTSTDAASASRYFFHLCNGNVYPDASGTCFSSAEDAVSYGSRVAQELAEDGGWNGYAVAVADANGNEIARVLVGRRSKDHS